MLAIDHSPWTTIWFFPKSTVRRIVDSDPTYRLWVLVVLGGIGQCLSNASVRNMGDLIPIPTLLVLCLISGPISGLIALYIGGWLLETISHRLGGESTREQVRACIAWSWAPVVCTLPLWGVKYILFREEIFYSKKPFLESEPILSNLFMLLLMVDLVISVWSFIILFNTLSEVNRFSTFRGMAAVVITGLIVTIPLIFLLLFLKNSFPLM